MLELNDAVLEVVSGGRRGSSITITNKNYSNVKLSHVELGKDSTLAIFVTQSIG